MSRFYNDKGFHMLDMGVDVTSKRFFQSTQGQNFVFSTKNIKLNGFCYCSLANSFTVMTP